MAHSTMSDAERQQLADAIEATQLRAKLAEREQEQEIGDAFHREAVAERDYARAQCEALALALANVLRPFAGNDSEATDAERVQRMKEIARAALARYHTR